MTNSEIVSRIISRSIWLLDMRDDMDKELLARIHEMFPGRTDKSAMSYRKMIGKDRCSKILLLYFKQTDVFYGEDVPDRVFDSSEYDKMILLDYKAIFALNIFLAMNNSKESIDYLLDNIDFATIGGRADKKYVVSKFRDKIDKDKFE